MAARWFWTLLILTVFLIAAAACSGRSDPAAPQDSLPAPKPTTSVTSTEPVTGLRTVTGAAEGPRDTRLAAPANGRRVEEHLRAGTCFNEWLDDGDAGRRRRTTVVGCGDAHDAEVLATIEIPSGFYSPFPGADEVDRLAAEECLAAFEPYVGADYAQSRLRLAVLRPDEASWAEGDRQIRCSAYDLDLVPLIGSVKGWAQ